MGWHRGEAGRRAARKNPSEKCVRKTAKLAHPVASCGMCRSNNNNNNSSGNKNTNNKNEEEAEQLQQQQKQQQRQQQRQLAKSSKNAAKRLGSILNVTQTAQRETEGTGRCSVNRVARIPSVAVIENEDYELNIKAHNSSSNNNNNK